MRDIPCEVIYVFSSVVLYRGSEMIKKTLILEGIYLDIYAARFGFLEHVPANQAC